MGHGTGEKNKQVGTADVFHSGLHFCVYFCLAGVGFAKVDIPSFHTLVPADYYYAHIILLYIGFFVVTGRVFLLPPIVYKFILPVADKCR